MAARAESISHSFASLTHEILSIHHSKIKLVSPHGHVISSISRILQFGSCVLYSSRCKKVSFVNFLFIA